jgi:hypothetical protein
MGGSVHNNTGQTDPWKGIKFQLIETGRPEGNEVWESTAPPLSTNGWYLYHFDFSSFTRVDGAGNNRLDLHSIGTYGLSFGMSTPPGTYNIDEIKAVPSGGAITVSDPTCDFGICRGTLQAHRFKTDPIRIDYQAFIPPWAIRIYTNNGGGANRAGLIGATDSTQVIPLMVWCANFGPTATVPDQNNDTYWVHEDDDPNAVGWFRVPEGSEMTSDRYTWRRLAWNGPKRYPTDAWQTPAPVLSNPFYIYLAIDVLGKKNQVYATNTLTVECINE